MSTSSARSRTRGASARSPGSCARETGLARVALRAGERRERPSSTPRPRSARAAAPRSPLPARAVLVLALIELDRLDDAAAACDASTPELRFARGLLRLARCERTARSATCCRRPRSSTADAIEGPARDPLALGRGARAPAGRARRWRGRSTRSPCASARRARSAARCACSRPSDPRRSARSAAGPPSAALEGSEARLEHAHALCDLGASLRRERARRDAREPLREALDLAVRCGAAALARRAREELAATGARPRRLAQSGRDALTPAELRVARLAARGLANREIAQTLVVTVKTVETELGHAYAKLGIRSRRELPACSRRPVRTAGARPRAGPARRGTRAPRTTRRTRARGSAARRRVEQAAVEARDPRRSCTG